jgi:hypothetical protein
MSKTQVLLIKNQMGYVSSFTPNESDGDLYQVLLLKNQMGYASSFTPQESPSDSLGVKFGTDPHLIL